MGTDFKLNMVKWPLRNARAQSITQISHWHGPSVETNWTVQLVSLFGTELWHASSGKAVYGMFRIYMIYETMTPGFLNYETLLGSRTKKRFGNMSP
jgi:hypothetical protein